MSETLVTIGKYLDVTEAQIAAGLLKSEGIPVYPPDINHAAANALPGVGLGDVRLQAPARFEQEARRLLANRDSSAEAELTFLATGERSTPEEVESDRFMFGILSISDRVKRKEFWIKLAFFDIAFVALAILAILKMS
jgi:hypothetical protein